MASAPILEIDSLLEPIPGEEAAGFAVPFNVRRQLDEHRKEIVAEESRPENAPPPEEAKSADWSAVIKLAQETLKETSKDLLVAARLTEALTKESGFAGLRDGMTLMRRLVEECWDRVHPSIEDGDVEVRAAAFNWLDDADRGARFPNTIRGVGILPGEEKKLSWRNWRDVMDGKGSLTKEHFETAMNTITREEIQDIVDDLGQTSEEIEKAIAFLNEKMGDVAPGMMEVMGAVRECKALADQVLERKGPPPEAEAAPADGEETDLVEVIDDGDVGEGGGENGAAAPRRRGESRQDVYAQLEDVANKLMRIDPHSPISYLVQRAVKLSKLSLPQLLRVLIRNADALTDLSRDLDLGVEESAPAEENNPE
jgi:type VI secretion system protein ImpA